MRLSGCILFFLVALGREIEPVEKSTGYRATTTFAAHFLEAAFGWCIIRTRKIEPVEKARVIWATTTFAAHFLEAAFGWCIIR
ncbi:hypothetical protein HPB50_020877 [Hyalomma asiaticum]|uniref:Uncharacterized protein n=1 Tax=Hyalomma asiaticum TaxID=266040 RepID=A0ACB7T765_HYAAI|nr:hypothetical protein HPB50_020877 [Hyalomma asiaticum]